MASKDDDKRGAPLSEWMKIMLDEIERKEGEEEEAREELARRGQPNGEGGAKGDESTDTNG